ncbi:Mss4-like protein [Irpex lacteus]|nr:Mss4-like protein [Irpex lacteus]
MSSDATSHNQTDASQTAVCYLGSCLCGQIAFKIVGQPKFVTLCHCSHCSKWTGSGFAWNAAFTPEQFSFTKGETLHRLMNVKTMLRPELIFSHRVSTMNTAPNTSWSRPHLCHTQTVTKLAVVW